MVTDCWRAYYTLRSCFKYLKVNHSKNLMVLQTRLNGWQDIQAFIPKHFLEYLVESDFTIHTLTLIALGHINSKLLLVAGGAVVFLVTKGI